MIPETVKVACLDARAQGKTAREVYETVFLPAVDDPCSLEAFKRSIRKWRHRYADPDTLDAGTYQGFIPNAATVQVDARGNITQAWIKQRAEIDWEEIAAMLSEGIEPQRIEPCQEDGESMLEIPLFDLHFGHATAETYSRQLAELLGIIEGKVFAEINILFGQDNLHTNDLRGHTAKGTDIGVIDFPAAWRDAWGFWAAIIRACIEHAKSVRIWYSRGNHDELSSWCLFKALAVAFPTAQWDDSITARKCLTWQGCFIGFGHCEYTGRAGVLFQNFVNQFPHEFAAATVREIHAGHLHRESVDEGIMVRRLATAAPATKWEEDNGLIGAHRRFQVFEWMPGRLRSIYYI